MDDFLKKMKMKRCDHTWKLVINKELESPYEQLIRFGETFDSVMGLHWGIDLFKKTAVVIMVCEKCGVVDKSIVSSVGRNLE